MKKLLMAIVAVVLVVCWMFVIFSRPSAQPQQATAGHELTATQVEMLARFTAWASDTDITLRAQYEVSRGYPYAYTHALQVRNLGVEADGTVCAAVWFRGTGSGASKDRVYRYFLYGDRAVPIPVETDKDWNELGCSTAQMVAQ